MTGLPDLKFFFNDSCQKFESMSDGRNYALKKWCEKVWNIILVLFNYWAWAKVNHHIREEYGIRSMKYNVICSFRNMRNSDVFNSNVLKNINRCEIGNTCFIIIVNVNRFSTKKNSLDEYVKIVRCVTYKWKIRFNNKSSWNRDIFWSCNSIKRVWKWNWYLWYLLMMCKMKMH